MNFKGEEVLSDEKLSIRRTASSSPDRMAAFVTSTGNHTVEVNFGRLLCRFVSVS